MCFGGRPKIIQAAQPLAAQSAPLPPPPIVAPLPPPIAQGPVAVKKQSKAATKARQRRTAKGGISGKRALTIPLSVPTSSGVNVA